MQEVLSGCVFCRIVTGEAPATIVHSSDEVLAFRDVRPVAPVHILLIPKRHVTSAAELGEGHGDVLVELFATAAHLARAEGIERSGWRIVTNVGPDAGQSVEHLHLHLLGGRRMSWPPG
jgi:histidine triad (HIT) family protein